MKTFVQFNAALMVLCLTAGAAGAYPVTDTFTDIANQGEDPGSYALVDEHGGPSAAWAALDEDILLEALELLAIPDPGNDALIHDLLITLTNTSDHTLLNTTLAFEENAVAWKTGFLRPDTWDGTDSSGDAAYNFGDLAPGESRQRRIELRLDVLTVPLPVYDSFGLNSSADADTRGLGVLNTVNGETPGPSNVSITHAVPEPGTIALVSFGALALVRRVRKKR